MNHAEQDEGGGYRGRFDFVIETTNEQEDGQLAVFLRPDMRRYDMIEIDGERFYRDKYLRVLIPIAEMARAMTDQMSSMPIHLLEPSIDSATEYATERKDAISQELSRGEHIHPRGATRGHTAFADNLSPRNIAFLSIDICNGTARRRENRAAFERAYKILFQEFAALVGQFSGKILKPTGDGCIAYIDYPAFTSACDATVDLGLSLLLVLSEAVNPSLGRAGLAPLDVRIGADFGLAEVRELTVPSTGFVDHEVASDALNRAVKIEQSCAANEFRIGRSLYELIHVKWLERSETVAFDGDSIGLPGYPVYRLR